MNIVEVRKNEVFCDSSLVAKKFGQKHKEVVKRIKKLETDLSEIRGVLNPPKIIKEIKHYRGTDYESYLMNRQFFSLLVMRFRGKKALEWQSKFNDAFYEMEKRLLFVDKNATDPKWLNQRSLGKVARREETDIIKEFVKYATEQGSKKANFYYKHLTNCTYKALGLMVQKKPKLRDTMDLYELSELLLAEMIARKSIKKYMDLGRHYKDVYESVKDDLLTFGSGLKLE